MKNGNEATARIVEALEKLGVDYLLAGSFSSNFYGISRSTKDADVVAEDVVVRTQHVRGEL